MRRDILQFSQWQACYLLIYTLNSCTVPVQGLSHAITVSSRCRLLSSDTGNARAAIATFICHVKSERCQRAMSG